MAIDQRHTKAKSLFQISFADFSVDFGKSCLDWIQQLWKEEESGAVWMLFMTMNYSYANISNLFLPDYFPIRLQGPKIHTISSIFAAYS